jgi:hypothetical protein
MSIQAATFDTAKRLDLYARKNRDGSKKFTFLTSSGTAYDISAIDFKLNIKSKARDTTNVLQLTVGSGLTVGGTGNNELTVTLTDTQTNIKAVNYYWELFNDTADKTWLHGEFIVSNGLSEEITESSSVTVNLDPDVIEITIGESAALLSGGSAKQLPFVNSDADGFQYSQKLTWDDTNNRMLAGGGTTTGGTNNYNFGSNTTMSSSWCFSVAEESTIRGNNQMSSGWFHEIGDGVNSGSGSGGITIGTNNRNYGLGAYVGGIGGQVTFFGTTQRGGFVHAFQVGSSNGKKPSDVPFLIAIDGAFNVSRNTNVQTDGNGALAQDSGILCGINANVPATSPRAVAIGGSGLNVPDSSPDTVMVDNFLVERQTLGSVVAKYSSVATNDNPAVQIIRTEGPLLMLPLQLFTQLLQLTIL